MGSSSHNTGRSGAARPPPTHSGECALALIAQRLQQELPCGPTSWRSLCPRGPPRPQPVRLWRTSESSECSQRSPSPAAARPKPLADRERVTGWLSPRPSPITTSPPPSAGPGPDSRASCPRAIDSRHLRAGAQVAELLSTADCRLVNGLKLEDPTRELAEQNLKDGAEIVELGDDGAARRASGSTTSRSPRRTGSPTRTCGPIRLRDQVRRPSSGHLTQRDPEGAATTSELRRRSRRRLTELSDALRKDRRRSRAGAETLLTYHDAYAYFARTTAGR